MNLTVEVAIVAGVVYAFFKVDGNVEAIVKTPNQDPEFWRQEFKKDGK